MTVLFLNPSNEQLPLGGVLKIYDFAAALADSGVDTAVVQGVDGFRPQWFDSSDSLQIRYAPMTVTSSDLLVIPEYLGSALATAVPGAARVSLNQGAYNTFLHCDWRQHPYSTVPLAGVGVVSEDSAEYVRFGWPHLDVAVLRPGLDPSLWHAGAGPRARRIAYMPRKRADVIDQVLGLLTARGELAGWELHPIEGLPRTDVAAELRKAPLFLSFGQREGFGLPPLEALASGCHVIGFAARGGREFFVEPHATAVEEDDVLGFAKAVGTWLAAYDDVRFRDLSTAASVWVMERYTVAEERSRVVSWLEPLHSALPSDARPLGTLRPEDTWPPHGRPRSRAYRIARNLRHAFEE